MLAGNVAALLSPLVFVPVLTFAFGRQKYDWQSMLEIRKGDDSDLAAAAHVDLELVPGASNVSEDLMREEQRKLTKAAFIARTMTVVMTLALLVLWPSMLTAYPTYLPPAHFLPLHYINTDCVSQCRCTEVDIFSARSSSLVGSPLEYCGYSSPASP
jgi:hypothetical protein